MEFLEKPPLWLMDLLPQSARDLLEAGGWWVVLGFAVLAILLIAWALLARLGRALFGRRPVPPPERDLTEDLAALGPPTTRAGPDRLTYEGLPVRVRLIVVAPTAKDVGISRALVPKLLERLLPGLSEIVVDDEPRVRIWPGQHSYDGFAVTFHRSTPLPEGEGKQSQWIPVAGRAKIGPQPLLLGLVLWAEEPTTLTRRTLEPHEWSVALRIKPRRA